MSNVGLVIFDLDGTLVDSEKLCNQAFLDLIPELDLTVDQLVCRFRGSKLSVIMEGLSRLIGRPLPSDFEADYRIRVTELFESELRPMPNADEVLTRLDVPYCIASSGPPSKIHKALEVSGLGRYFDNNVFSSYDVRSWKPEPWLFLHAAHIMGFLPESCCVVEDSLPGIQGANAAGMRAFWYNPQGAEELGLDVITIINSLI